VIPLSYKGDRASGLTHISNLNDGWGAEITGTVVAARKSSWILNF